MEGFGTSAPAPVLYREFGIPPRPWLRRCAHCWDEAKAGTVGMEGAGASAPAPVLYREFGITAEAVAAKVRALLG